jgi:hypothetical protein
MPIEGKIDALIDAGWYVLETGFDREAFLHWRVRAYECLIALLGPGHHYTEHFRSTVRQSDASDILAGVGVLAAASLTDLPGTGTERCSSKVDVGLDSHGRT